MSQFSFVDSGTPGGSPEAESFGAAGAGDAGFSGRLAESIPLFDQRAWTATRDNIPAASDHASLPVLKLDGISEKLPAASAKPDASIERDEKGNIARITYPDGKTREFARDASGSLNSVTTRDKQGESKLVKENGKWAAEVEGKKLPLPGTVSLSASGELSVPLDGAGTYRCDRTDGTSTIEKANATAARVCLDKDGQVKRITRPDGSAVEARLDNGVLSEIVETKADGSKPLTWQKKNDVFTSDGQPPQQRINMALNENGNLTYTGSDGLKHIVRGNGAELLEGPGKGKFTFDKQGRIASIEYADGKKTRTFGYEGETNKINSVLVDDKVKHTTRIYRRNGSTDTWTITDGSGKKIGSWQGEATLAPDGTYSLKRADGRQNRGEDPDADKKDKDREKEKEKDGDGKRRGKDDSGGEDGEDEEGGRDGGEDGSDDEGGSDRGGCDGGGCDRRRRRRRGRRHDGRDRGGDGDRRGSDDSDSGRDDDENDDGESDRRKGGDGEDDGDADDEGRGRKRGEDESDDDRESGGKDKKESSRDADDDQSDDNWHSFRPDGSDARERVAPDGSRATFDRAGNLTTIRRADGSAVDAVYTAGKLTQVIESNAAVNEKTTWTKQKDDTWTSDSPQHPEIRRDLSFNKDGDMSYRTADGVTRTVRLDGSTA